MADLYKQYLKAVLTGGTDVDLLTENVKIVFVDTADYTVDLTNHDFLADIPAGARVATSGNLTGKGFNILNFDAADISLPGVTGDTFEAIVGYIDTGSEATSRLVWYDDSIAATTPNAGAINVVFNASGIFSLTGAGNLYPRTLLAGMTGTSINVLTSDIKAVCVDAADYTADLTNDDFLADITGAGRVATSANLANKTFTGVAFDADDFDIAGVSGDTFEEVIFYIDTAVESTSRLLYRKTTGAGLPFSPNAGQISFTINASGVFSL